MPMMSVFRSRLSTLSTFESGSLGLDSLAGCCHTGVTGGRPDTNCSFGDGLGSKSVLFDSNEDGLNSSDCLDTRDVFDPNDSLEPKGDFPTDKESFEPNERCPESFVRSPISLWCFGKSLGPCGDRMGLALSERPDTKSASD